jgi:hypothetical protein
MFPNRIIFLAAILEFTKKHNFAIDSYYHWSTRKTQGLPNERTIEILPKGVGDFPILYFFSGV